MTLHEAIVIVLRNKNQRMTTKQIANELNKLGLYTKRDGSPITDYQIHGRTKNYSHLFTRDKTIVGLVEWGDDKKPISNSISQTKSIKNSQITQSDSKIAGDITKISFLVEMCFKNIGSLDTILENGLPKMEELNKCGLYSITIPSNYQVGFIPPEECIGNNVINPWSIQKLKDKWVDDVDVVYYGIAGKQSNRSLR